MKVADIANEIYMDLGEPTDLSVSAISYWVRASIGKLNSMIFENFALNQDFEIVDSSNSDAEINIDAVAILKKTYLVHRYSVIVRSKLTDLGSDDVIEVQDQDSKVKRVDKNQLIKTISAEKKQEEDELRYLINAYRTKSTNPKQVVGDDIVQGRHPSYEGHLRSNISYTHTSL